MLSHDQEKKLLDYAHNCAAMGTGFGRRQFTKYAENLAAKHRVHFQTGGGEG